MFKQDHVIRVPRALILMIVICAFAIISCTVQQPSTEAVTTDHSENGAIATANAVLDALEQQDGTRLAALVHPQKGVRFSPSAYVDIKVDRVFSRDQIERFWIDRSTYLWGYADGTGDPIMLTPAQYWREYIMIKDFSQASSVNLNDDQAFGNTLNNVVVVYPAATRVEYYIKSSTRDSVEQLDWAALRLVLEQVDGSWFLVGVILDQWSV